MMRSFWHLTPRYVKNRIFWGWYQHRNPDKPWLTPEATHLLSTLLLPTDIGLEWGSGRSTSWFAAKIAKLTSIEHHAQWYERVRQTLAEKNLDVDYRLHSVSDAQDSPDLAYVRVVDDFQDESLGFALVDGVARASCALAVLPKLAPGAILVLDNADRYLDHPSYSPNNRWRKGPLNNDWKAFAQQVDRWRIIWTSTGVTDTAIWIKPQLATTARGIHQQSPKG